MGGLNSENILVCGEDFLATDKQGNTYLYKFMGINISDSTGCGYIKLWNSTTDTFTDVEFAWFRERKIKMLT